MKKLFLSALVAGLLHAAPQVVSGDGGYYVHEQEGYRYVYPEEHGKHLDKLHPVNKQVNEHYRRSFAHRLDDQGSIILASSNNQIANAYARVLPNTAITFYGGGAAYADYFTSASWLTLLTLHENAHLYQLDAKSDVSRSLKDAFGNTFFLLPIYEGFLVPLFTFPNDALPTMILEGNGVFNESRFGNGGRLYGGRHRALFYALLKDGKLDLNRLTNNHVWFPFDEEKYIVGGYFQYYLAERFGTDTVNRYFNTHAEHFINPLYVGSSFREQYGEDYRTLVGDFLDHYRPEAEKQHALEGEVLGESLLYQPLNRTGGEILFQATPDFGRSSLVVFDTADHRYTKELRDFLPGKVFRTGTGYATLFNGRVKTNKIAYALFNEEMEASYPSRIVQEIEGGHMAWIDPKTSFDRPRLYLDKTFYGETDSSVLLDGEGNLYYFRQRGDRRTLYKNKTPLFSYEGYEGKPVDVEGETIWFTAPTPYGSSLFQYREGEFLRLSPADTIIDAKMAGPGMFLACSVTGEGYRYQVGKIRPIAEGPTRYHYYFETEPSFAMLDENASYPPVDRSADTYYQEERRMQFSYLYPQYTYSSGSGTVFAMDAVFNDPMELNTLTLSYYVDSDLESSGLSYRNSRYPVNFGVQGYVYSKQDMEPQERTRAFGGFLTYPYYRTNTKEFTLSLYGYQDHENEADAPLVAQALFQDFLKLPYSYDYNRLNLLSLFHRSNGPERTYGAGYTFGYEPGHQFFIRGEGKAAFSDSRSIKIKQLESGDADVSNTYLKELHRLIYSKQVTTVAGSIKKVFSNVAYSPVVPLGVRKAALFLEDRYVIYKDAQEQRETINERSLGCETEMLAAHKYPFTATFAYVINSDADYEGSYYFNFGFDF